MSLISHFLDAIEWSPTLAISKQVVNLRRQGAGRIHLPQGEPDFTTPDHINTATKQTIDQGFTKYTDVDGTRCSSLPR